MEIQTYEITLDTGHWTQPSEYMQLFIRLLPSWPMVKILTGPVHFRVTLDTLSGYPEPWSSKILGSEIESTF